MSQPSVDSTPQKKRSGSRSSATNFASDCTDQWSLRMDDARKEREYRRFDFDDIARCALPKNSTLRDLVDKRTKEISHRLDDILVERSQDPETPALVRQAANECRKWLRGELISKNSSRYEKVIYPAHAALIRCIAGHLDPEPTSAGGTDEAKRVLLPYASDLKPTGSDKRIRIDGALRSCADASSADDELRPDYRDIVLVAEAKWRREQDKAYDQLIRYTRQVYANQPNRRFAWGVTICATLVRVILFENDRMVSSKDMDVTTSTGLAAYIKFIVSLCFCEEHQLGYDPSMTWCSENEYWIIKCPGRTPDNDDEQPATYYARDPVFVADHLFGRHTRGFYASDDPELVDQPDTFIKDAWPHAERGSEDTSRDELAILQDIVQQLKTRGIDTTGYVRPVRGGTVRLDDDHDDNTDTVLDPVVGDIEAAHPQMGTIAENDETDAGALATKLAAGRGKDDEACAIDDSSWVEVIPYRVHRRLALKPIGKPLYALSSPYELIIVLADAMTAHSKILNLCGYLHRDISTNNILAIEVDGRVRGVLIDFDCAIKVGSQRRVRAERTGTPPFMSINNLRNSSVERSELDDWESLLYVVCWLGVYGVSGANQSKYQADIERKCRTDKNYKPPLYAWECGTFEEVARAKKENLEDMGTFTGSVLNHFQREDGYAMLKSLARRLHKRLLFNSHLDNKYMGMVKVYCGGDDSDESDDDTSKSTVVFVDPFAKRLEQKARDQINKDLMKTMAHYKAAACAMPTATKDCNDVEALTARISADLVVTLGAKPADLGALDGGLSVPEACREWLTGVRASGTESRTQVNNAHTSLIHFIACRMKELRDGLNASDAASNPKRFLLVCGSGQTQTKASENSSLNDLICAVVDPSVTQLGEANSTNTVLFVKAERSGRQDLAYCQLIHDTRSLYADQPNRRFAWGVTICATLVRVILFENDRMVSSKDMDVTTSTGLAAYIKFIVSLCFCEEHQLGYDPSMTWCSENKYWIIKCPGRTPDNDDEQPATYYARDPVFVADHLFGRHTRGFYASDDPELVDQPDTFIKDAWPHAERGSEDTSRDELAILQDIVQQLKTRGIDTTGYVRPVRGGTVRLDDDHDDNTDTVLDPVVGDIEAAHPQMGTIAENDETDAGALATKLAAGCGKDDEACAIDDSSRVEVIPYRVHRRLALKPIGKPLYALSSPYELIIVLADAMTAHSKILNLCGYLHRDISTNNILAIEVDGRVRGVLIDFDCAIKVGSQRRVRAERTGTPPFMSINNLRNSSVERSELDDWESLLYVVCWLGVYGVSGANQSKYQADIERKCRTDKNYKPPLYKWEYGTFEEVADSKERCLTGLERFTSSVLNHFKTEPGYDMLKELAHELCQWLLFNLQLDRAYRGVVNTTKPHYRRPGTRVNTNTIIVEDPFVKRLEKDARDKINDDLAEVMDLYKRAAVTALYGSCQ
ncbi:hypothetical protein IWW54_000455 [Coemansia sp. RSA 2705]|nr:hypothetical protein IWW54_000455 [Coemansia sp. RSA 2705]